MMQSSEALRKRGEEAKVHEGMMNHNSQWKLEFFVVILAEYIALVVLLRGMTGVFSRFQIPV
jgi:hypothetical protein